MLSLQRLGSILNLNDNNMPVPDPSSAELGTSLPSAAQMEEDFAMAAESSSEDEEDIVMAEAGEVQGVEEDTKAATEPPAAQTVEDESIGVEIKQETKPAIKQEGKPEVKLEDLFEGLDSDDDEFIAPPQGL